MHNYLTSSNIDNCNSKKKMYFKCNRSEILTAVFWTDVIICCINPATSSFSCLWGV